MIRTDVIVNTKAIDNLQAFMQAFPDYAEPVITSTFEQYKPGLLDELRTQPGSVKYPILWSSEKQRKAFFASNGFGGGIPYKRTGKTARSWYAWVRRSGNRFELGVANSSPSAKFLYGNLRPKPGGDPQQRFHRITGWQKVAPTVDFWVNAYRDELARQMLKLVSTGGRS